MEHTTHVTIDRRGLVCMQIRVTAESTAELVEYTPEMHSWTAQSYRAILVDGLYYPLVLSKHTSGRPEIEQALDAALADVRAAIDALNTPVCYATREDRAGRTYVSAYRDGARVSRLPYDRTPAGQRRAEMRLADLAAQGYPLRSK